MQNVREPQVHTESAVFGGKSDNLYSRLDNGVKIHIYSCLFRRRGGGGCIFTSFSPTNYMRLHYEGMNEYFTVQYIVAQR